MITIEQFNELKDAQEQAHQDDTPYMAVVDNEVKVLGNPNKTEKKKGEYRLLFAYPNTAEWKTRFGNKVLRETEDYLVIEKVYKDVFIPARLHNAVTEAFTRIQMYTTKIAEIDEESGVYDVKPLSDEESLAMISVYNYELQDAILNAIGVVLKLSEEELDYISITSAMQTIVQMYANIPEAENEANLFTGLL